MVNLEIVFKNFYGQNPRPSSKSSPMNRRKATAFSLPTRGTARDHGERTGDQKESVEGGEGQPAEVSGLGATHACRGRRPCCPSNMMYAAMKAPKSMISERMKTTSRTGRCPVGSLA